MLRREMEMLMIVAGRLGRRAAGSFLIWVVAAASEKLVVSSIDGACRFWYINDARNQSCQGRPEE